MKKLAIVAALALVTTLGVSGSAGAGEPTGNTGSATKVVVGPGPAGPYEFGLVCTGGSVNFSLNDGESDGGGLPGTSCTLTETNDQGADSVTYDCQIISGPGTCEPGGQTVTLPVGATPTDVEWTITNTFQPPTTTTTTAPTTTTTAPTTTTTVAPAVAATPSFTG